MRFKVRRSGAQYLFRIVASNGQKLCHSENYVNKGEPPQRHPNIQGGAGGRGVPPSKMRPWRPRTSRASAMPRPAVSRALTCLG